MFIELEFDEMIIEAKDMLEIFNSSISLDMPIFEDVVNNTISVFSNIEDTMLSNFMSLSDVEKNNIVSLINDMVILIKDMEKRMFRNKTNSFKQSTIDDFIEDMNNISDSIADIIHI